MKLSGEDWKELCEAITDAYREKTDLKKIVRFKLNENLNNIAEGEKLNDIVFNLIEWAETQGKLKQLIKALHDGNPGNEKLKSVKQRLLPSICDGTDVSTSGNFLNEHWDELLPILSKIDSHLLSQVCRVTLGNNPKIQDVTGNYPELIELGNLDTLDPLKTILLKTILLKCPDNDKGVPTIIEFAKRLSQENKVEQSYRIKLTDWVQTVAHKLHVNLPTYAETISSDTAESYLLITVQPKGSNTKGSNKFYVEAELIINYAANDNDIKKRPIKLDLEQEQGEVECHNNEITDIIYKFILVSKARLPLDHILTIELFLPLQYLATDIDIQPIPLDLGSQAIGNEYRFAVRSIERITSDAGEYLTRLSQRWNCLTSLTKKRVSSYIEYIDTINNCNWGYLANTWRRKEKLGVKIICGLPESDGEKQKLLISILRGGVPLALWLRSSNLPQEEQDKFKKIVKLEHLKDLRNLFKVVLDERQKAHGQTENAMNYFGYHLGLLCDHPHRIPYHLKPKSRKLRETGT